MSALGVLPEITSPGFMDSLSLKSGLPHPSRPACVGAILEEAFLTHACLNALVQNPRTQKGLFHPYV